MSPNVPNLVLLEALELVPVLQLEPHKFATCDRDSPSGVFQDDQDAWFLYWATCLADSGITGLRPLRQGSWHVPTANFNDSGNLRRFLQVTFHDWGGIDSPSNPDRRAILDGGLALRGPAGDVLVEPGCCADLGDANNWKMAAEHRGPEWQILWIGHPWISVRYEAPWLILSGPHESGEPSGRWTVLPE